MALRHHLCLASLPPAQVRASRKRARRKLREISNLTPLEPPQDGLGKGPLALQITSPYDSGDMGDQPESPTTYEGDGGSTPPGPPSGELVCVLVFMDCGRGSSLFCSKCRFRPTQCPNNSCG